MFRRTSVVHLVDELGQGQRRERAREDFQVLLVGVAWALWGVRVELVLAVVLAALQRWVSGLLGDVAGGVAVVVVVAAALLTGPVRRFVLGALAGDAAAAGVGAGNDRLGRRD